MKLTKKEARSLASRFADSIRYYHSAVEHRDNGEVSEEDFSYILGKWIGFEDTLQFLGFRFEYDWNAQGDICRVYFPDYDIVLAI